MDQKKSHNSRGLRAEESDIARPARMPAGLTPPGRQGPPAAVFRLPPAAFGRLTADRSGDPIGQAPKTLQHRFSQTLPEAAVPSVASAGSAADRRPFGGRSPRVLCRVFGSRHQRRPLAWPEKPDTGASHERSPDHGSAPRATNAVRDARGAR
jgi:hypothetical protein